MENVLNSNESLRIDSNFHINIGLIENPKGGSGRGGSQGSKIRPLTEADLVAKRSVVWNRKFKDDLCLHRSVTLAWLYTNRVTTAAWRELTNDFVPDDGPVDALFQKVLKYRKTPDHFYREMLRNDATSMARLTRLTLLVAGLAGVRVDRKGDLDTLPYYNDFLKTHINVLDMNKARKFVTPKNRGPDQDLYLVLCNDHLGVIKSVQGFFRTNHFCASCQKGFDKFHNHKCKRCCTVCRSTNCQADGRKYTCFKCNQKCRSKLCLDRHRARKNACESVWRCPDYGKLLDTSIDKQTNSPKNDPKKHVCGEYLCTCCCLMVSRPHKCYMRARQPKNKPLKIVHFDFECRFDDLYQCSDGYSPANPSGDNCVVCSEWGEHRCSRCRRCQSCDNTSCGFTEHRPNLAVAHSTCDDCLDSDEALDERTKCYGCGSRCETCWAYDRKEKCFAKMPCQDTCGFRKVVFKGDDTTSQFGSWLFSKAHTGFIVMVHNLKGKVFSLRCCQILLHIRYHSYHDFLLSFLQDTMATFYWNTR